MHRGVSTPSARRPVKTGGCLRWNEAHRLLSSNGELVRGRCRASNLCDYCCKQQAVENAEVLSLDAMVGTPPSIWVTLTTRTVTNNTALFYESRRKVVKALKRRWPDVQYWCTLEFTTGYASAGERRPHWHILLKGVPVEDLDLAGTVIRRVWCEREDAEPIAQHVGLVHNAGGLMRYLVLHMSKESQRPPDGWRGIRSTHSRGYLWEPTPVARELARDQLASKRALWKAEQRGLGVHDAELACQVALDIRKSTTWKLHRMYPEGTSDRQLARHRPAYDVFPNGKEPEYSDLVEVVPMAATNPYALELYGDGD